MVTKSQYYDYIQKDKGLVGLLATILRHPVVRLHGGKMRACVIIQ